MSMRFRKSKKILPGVKLNLNAKSASISIGPKGLKKTFSTTGRTTTTVGIPGSGLSYSSSKKLGTPAASETNYENVAAFVPSNKNKWVALVLCIFFGYIGAHRFYVGKTGSGVLYIFTVGVFSIGWLVDIFKICLNKFTDKNGSVIGIQIAETMGETFSNTESADGQENASE